MLGKMISIAAEAHCGQVDKAGQPYFLHCLKVMENLPRYSDESLRCIAIGHDLFEDTDISPAYLQRQGFSDRIVRGIYHLTKREGMSFETYKQQVKANHDSLIVKLADLRHNMDITRLREPNGKDVERAFKYLQFYQELQEHWVTGK